jgi:hypothetical protein
VAGRGLVGEMTNAMVEVDVAWCKREIERTEERDDFII